MRALLKMTPALRAVRDQFGPIVISLALVAAMTASMFLLIPFYTPVRVPNVYLIPVL